MLSIHYSSTADPVIDSGGSSVLKMRQGMRSNPNTTKLSTAEFYTWENLR